MCNSKRLLVVLSLLCETSQDQLPIFDARLRVTWIPLVRATWRWANENATKQKKSFGHWDFSLLWTGQLDIILLRLTSWNHLLQLQLSLSWKQPNQLVSKSCRLWLCQQKNWVRRIICFKIRFQRGAQQCQSRESRSARTSERIARMQCVNWLHQWTNLCTGDSTLYRKGRSWKKD